MPKQYGGTRSFRSVLMRTCHWWRKSSEMSIVRKSQAQQTFKCVELWLASALSSYDALETHRICGRWAEKIDLKPSSPSMLQKHQLRMLRFAASSKNLATCECIEDSFRRKHVSLGSLGERRFHDFEQQSVSCTIMILFLQMHDGHTCSRTCGATVRLGNAACASQRPKCIRSLDACAWRMTWCF